MDYATLICAVVAVVVLARLWYVLGQRTDGKERPNPFALRTEQPPPRPVPPVYAPASLAGGLAQIQAADPAFDEKQFLQTARESFAAILSDFAKGDMSGSATLLAPSVLPHFENAIQARKQAGQTMELKLSAIRHADCTAAQIENGKATITVSFDSEQSITLRDAEGNIVGGSGKKEEITDIWTFTRDMPPAKADWILTETRS